MNVLVPISDMHAHLMAYQARGLPEYSNLRRHVYHVPHLNKYITVRKVGNRAEFEFTNDCPCNYED